MTIQEDFTRVLRETGAGRASEITKEIDGERYVRRFIPEERLILLGGGHIAVPLCKMASMLDFAVTVADDRPSFANSARFPDAAQVICESFAKAIEDLQIRPSDYVCVITRGHRWDAECLREILPGTFPSYLGMMGSRRRVRELFELLKGEGYDAERIAKIRQISLEEAEAERKETDRFRRAYHNFYSDSKWGDSRAYDLIINSSRLGIQGTADYIKTFADAFKEI